MVIEIRSWAIALLMAVFAAGCGGGAGGPERVAVSGTVTLDGEPLESGSITFLPTEGTKGPSAGGNITNGAYLIAPESGPVVGKMRVEISSPRSTGQKVKAEPPSPPGTMVDEIVEAVPPQYNTKSTLGQDLESGTNTANFELTSK